MEQSCCVEFGGYHTPYLLPRSHRGFFGEPGNRLCILLCEPLSYYCGKLISISERNPSLSTSSEMRKVFESDLEPESIVRQFRKKQHHVYNNDLKIQLAEKIRKTNTDIDEGNISRSQSRTTIIIDGDETRNDTADNCVRSSETQVYKFRITDLSSLLLSEIVLSNKIDDGNIGPPQAKIARIDGNQTKNENGIYCVVQTNEGNMIPIMDSDRCKYLTGTSNGLFCNCPFCKNFQGNNLERTLWKRIAVLPTEMKMNVFQFMHFDQVSWLADNDEIFARSLAYHKYGVLDSHDRRNFPNKRSIIHLLRTKNALEMRFRGNEGLWICNFGGKPGSIFLPGMCRRYPVKNGTYTWRKALTMTTFRFDSSKCKCSHCLFLLGKLKERMDENQTESMLGRSRCKVFALKGSENVAIDTETTSVFWRETTTLRDFDQVVHMWTDGLDNRWLQDLIAYNGQKLQIGDYEEFCYFKTLFFKDPVKFFSTPKFVQYVDNDVIALVSNVDHEVLGYLVKEEDYRIRVPLEGQHGLREIIGLNFVSDPLMNEVIAASELAIHLDKHYIDNKVLTIENNIKTLKQQLKETKGNTEELKHALDNVYERLAELKIARGRGLTRTGIQREITEDNITHIHETFKGDFEFCSRYFFESLSLFSSIEKLEDSLDFIRRTDICGNNSCNINVIDIDKLQGYISMLCKNL